MQAFQSLIDNIFCNQNNHKIFIKNGKHEISYHDLHRQIVNLDKVFDYLKIEFASKIAIISQPSIEWIITDLTCIRSGIVSISLFPNLSKETLKFQIEDSKPQYIFVQDVQTMKYIQGIIDFDISKIVILHKEKHHTENGLQYFWDLIKLHEKDDISENFQIPQENPATIIYTSGTNGNPKGVILTYKNLATQLKDIQYSFPEVIEGDVAISILPLSHVFQRMIVYFYLSRGVNIHIINDIQNVVKHINTIQPQLITIVPRVLEKIYLRTKSQIAEQKPFLRAILTFIFNLSSRKILSVFHLKPLIDIVLYKKVRKIFGKNIKLIVCGGAKINEHEEIFFKNAGLNLLQGYGMTECSPVIASNTSKKNKIHSVGTSFPSLQVAISRNGEILVKGGSVFYGYLNEKPRSDEDFFHTGDVGFIDKKGFLHVTGRIKEQFKNANGKYVNPIKIENLLNEIIGVDISCIIAENRPYTVAVIFSQTQNIEHIQSEVARINSKLDHHEQIQYFYITKEKPTIENNIITPSMKLRRGFVYSKYSKEINEMYEATNHIKNR